MLALVLGQKVVGGCLGKNQKIFKMRGLRLAPGLTNSHKYLVFFRRLRWAEAAFCTVIVPLKSFVCRAHKKLRQRIALKGSKHPSRPHAVRSCGGCIFQWEKRYHWFSGRMTAEFGIGRV